MAQRIVVDTNVFVGALLQEKGHNRAVLRECLHLRAAPLMGQALFLEYEDVLGCDELFQSCPLGQAERQELFESFLSVCEWVQVYYAWRPNLRDEGDNHLVELAVAGGADAIVTNNTRDFEGADLRFAAFRVMTPTAFLKEIA